MAGQVARLLPLVLVVLVGDALQAVAGFALVGLKRSGPSLVSTVVWFGGLAVLAVPIADAAGLVGLWTALACANLLQAVTKTASFLRHGGRGSAVGAADVPGGSSDGRPAAASAEGRPVRQPGRTGPLRYPWGRRGSPTGPRTPGLHATAAESSPEARCRRR